MARDTDQIIQGTIIAVLDSDEGVNMTAYTKLQELAMFLHDYGTPILERVEKHDGLGDVEQRRDAIAAGWYGNFH